MNAPEDRSKALNEHVSSGFAPRADIVAACRHVRFVPQEATYAVQQIAAYSITSSARASSVGGTVRPSALAVLRLTMSSNFSFERTKDPLAEGVRHY